MPTIFQQRLPHLPSSWLVNQTTSISQHLDEQGLETSHKMASNWKASWGLPQWKTLEISPLPDTAYGLIKHAFLAKEWNSFHVARKKLDDLRLKDFLTMNLNCA